MNNRCPNCNSFTTVLRADNKNERRCLECGKIFTPNGETENEVERLYYNTHRDL